MRRRHFLRQAASLPLLGGAVAAGAAVTQESPIKDQIEHHVEALRQLIDKTKPEDVGDTALIIRKDSWDAQEGGFGKILNPAKLKWS